MADSIMVDYITMAADNNITVDYITMVVDNSTVDYITMVVDNSTVGNITMAAGIQVLTLDHWDLACLGLA
jgi:hypothetical protein